MKIDKTNDGVCFNEEFHTYWDSNGRYDSVTTIIGKFCHEFDSEFWSLYKALEKLMEPAAFAMEKKKLLDTKKIDKAYFIDTYELDEIALNNAQQDILDEWAQTNRESCERGTAIHAELEHSLTKNKTCEFKKYGLGGKFNVYSGDNPLDDRGIYPEYLIHVEDGDLRLAGQIDLLIKDGNTIHIIDYKGLPLNTKIATKDGWTTIRDIKEGDQIFDKDGNLTRVIHKSQVHYNPCFKITFDNGESIVADHEHKWLVSFRKDHTFVDKVMTTQELSEWLISKSRNSYTIPKILNPKPLNLEEIELPIDPYVLGCWLGDGSKSCGILTNVNPNVWEEIENRGYSFGDNLSGEDHAEMRTIYGIRGKLRDLGVLNNKFIPNLYMRASYQQRLDLLRGLMDTDGYYHESRKRFVMGTTQEWQAKDLVKLLGTLGIKSTIFEVDKKCNGKVFKGWDVCFSTNQLNPFLVRNQDITFPSKDKNSFRNIVSVERVDTIATQCIEVDSPSHTFLFGESLIVTHNTNRKLDEKSYFDSRTKKNQMMKYPLNNIMDCNKLHYNLQLSIYAWMLQQNNPDLEVGKLIIVHYDHKGNVTEYELPYLKEDVERLMKYWKNRAKIERQKEKRKPIEF